MLSLCKDILSTVCEVLTSSSHTGTSMPQAAGDGCDSKGMELMVQHAHACMPRSCKNYRVKVFGPFINSHGVLRMAGACTLQAAACSCSSGHLKAASPTGAAGPRHGDLTQLTSLIET